MASRRIDLMLEDIKKQNDYDFKIEKEKERIAKNIRQYRDKIKQEKNIKEERLLKRMEEVHKRNESNKNIKINKILSHHKTKDPLESIDFNSVPLVPITKDSIYNYINNYNFDRYKILYDNEEERMKLSKSVNFKISNYTLNKKKHMESIRNLFGERNTLSRRKTEDALEHFKQSNLDLRNKMNLEKAKKYNNFINYIRKKEFDTQSYNDLLNSKRIIAKAKYDNFFKRNDELILKRIMDLKYGKVEDDYSDSFKNIKTINDKNIERTIHLNMGNKIENKEMKKMKKLHDENVIKLNIEKQNSIKEILDKENKYFKKDNDKKNIMAENKKNSILSSLTINRNIENKLNEAKSIYDRTYKSEVIYKKS